MNKFLIYIFLFFLSGCSTVPAPSSVPVKTDQEVKVRKPTMAEQILQIQTPGSGIVAAKTDFQGLLKTTYVKLIAENRNDPSKVFQFIIGDKAGQNRPWEGKTVEPGYFFIELPSGKYKFSTIVIPVGSTFADENINVEFEVLPGVINYLGTLTIIGTKERIKWGGVPLIRPGFEYTIRIQNQEDEAVVIAKQKYPDYKKDMKLQLMKIGR